MLIFVKASIFYGKISFQDETPMESPKLIYIKGQPFKPYLGKSQSSLFTLTVKINLCEA